jgi:hypothetical protein
MNDPLGNGSEVFVCGEAALPHYAVYPRYSCVMQI